VEGADRKVVEGDFQRLLTGCSSHHANFDWHLRRKVREPNHRPFQVVPRIRNLDRVVITLHAQPEKRGVVRTGKYRPIGKLPRDHGTHALLAVQELNSSFDPVLVVDAYHQARMMIELMVFARDADLCLEVSSLFLIAKWTVVVNEPVMGHAPIVCAGRRRFGQGIPVLTPMCWRIKPGAVGGVISHRNRKHTEKRSKAATPVRLNGMPAYQIFGEFYDAVMGDRSGAAKHLLKLIRAAKPNARNVLELGCGTGSVLKHMQHKYQVSGLDTSSKMLSIARQKVPHARLFQQDMVDFQIDDRFDVICCVYDSINHVRRFSDWKKVFAGVRRHLAPGGCFIFDINTQRKLERHVAEPPWVHRFEKNLLIIKVTALANHASNWNIKVFEHLHGNRYVLHEEDIVEASFPSRKVVTALRVHFRKVQVIDPDGNRPAARSERLFFIATSGRGIREL